MKDEEKKYLLDILESIKNIDLHLLGNRDFKFFESNFTSRRAVEREIEIIGEATNQLLKLNPDVAISSARQIVNTRNRVIHSYDSVDLNILWRVIVRNIPVLENEILELLESESNK